MYVYIEVLLHRHVYRVGFYDPNGKFIMETEYDDWEEAADRVHYLNGGNA